MLREIPDGAAIRKATDRLLRVAAARNRLPTPVDDLVAAAGLTQPDHSMLSNFILAQAPDHIQRAFRKVQGKVQAILDRQAREIHIDPSIHNQAKIGYRKLHEVAHDILPWQTALGYAEDAAAFDPTLRKTFEWQANQGAAELLFQGDLFRDIASDYAISMPTILELAGLIGASGHAAFVRYVETHRHIVAGVVMQLSPCSTEPLGYRRCEVIYSEKWEARFGGAATWPKALLAQPYAFVNDIKAARRAEAPVGSNLVLPDLRNETVSLQAEVYCNQYKNFALIWLPRRELFRRRRIITPRSARSDS